jgi:hypothetical protein
VFVGRCLLQAPPLFGRTPAAQAAAGADGRDLAHERFQAVACPHCDQWALVVADDNSKCRFCTVRTDALDYVLHRDIGSNASYRRRLSCDNQTLVCGVLTAALPDVPVDLCFDCGKTFPR